ncbi:MAG: DUF2771 domain-containing protein [Corynebacterium sp.]|uniref:DUF2771 domain-containing protein n=1 Tax=Corynebacterium sp. TaxID=1720 RepID=UPI003F9E8982
MSTTTTKKQRRKAAQRRQLLTFLGIVVLVLLVAGVVFGVQQWMNNRPGTAPEDLRITATVNGEEKEFAPYYVCPVDAEDCDEEEPTGIPLGPDDEVTFELPEEIYDHDWTMLQIFDDPAANTENSYTAHEETEVTVKGSSDLEDDEGNNPPLTVVEFHSLQIGEDDDGEEEPYGAVWAFTPE